MPTDLILLPNVLLSNAHFVRIIFRPKQITSIKTISGKLDKISFISFGIHIIYDSPYPLIHSQQSEAIGFTTQTIFVNR